jgi:hypothetical protein
MYQAAHDGNILKTGEPSMSDTAPNAITDEQIIKAYLGLTQQSRLVPSYRQIRQAVGRNSQGQTVGFGRIVNVLEANGLELPPQRAQRSGPDDATQASLMAIEVAVQELRAATRTNNVGAVAVAIEHLSANVEDLSREAARDNDLMQAQLEMISSRVSKPVQLPELEAKIEAQGDRVMQGVASTQSEILASLKALSRQLATQPRQAAPEPAKAASTKAEPAAITPVEVARLQQQVQKLTSDLEEVTDKLVKSEATNTQLRRTIEAKSRELEQRNGEIRSLRRAQQTSAGDDIQLDGDIGTEPFQPGAAC